MHAAAPSPSYTHLLLHSSHNRNNNALIKWPSLSNGMSRTMPEQALGHSQRPTLLCAFCRSCASNADYPPQGELQKQNTEMLSVLVAIAATLAPGARAHGWISSPMARQLCDGRAPNGDYMPGGGNGAGPGMHDLGGVPGVCGDPFQTMQGATTKFADEPCSVQETYTEGVPPCCLLQSLTTCAVLIVHVARQLAACVNKKSTDPDGMQLKRKSVCGGARRGVNGDASSDDIDG